MTDYKSSSEHSPSDHEKKAGVIETSDGHVLADPDADVSEEQVC